MKNELACIMMIDDNDDDHFFHQRAITKSNLPIKMITMHSGIRALAYLVLKSEPHPDLILLDINMPIMSGWQFLEEYDKLNKELQSHALIMMLTTSENPSDEKRSETIAYVSGYIRKPLTVQMLKDISEKHF